MHSAEPSAYTTPQDWCITGDLPPSELWPIIRDRYIIPLQRHWYTHGIGLVPSLNSVYRPVSYEISKGRPGTSLHCFPAGTFGAADLTMHDGSKVKHVIDSVVEHLPFRRICYYEAQNFIHVDYGENGRRSGDRRSLWLCSKPGGSWTRMSWLPEPVI